MNEMRERTKEHFPTVLLTLLSIVQALALELLWSHLGEAPHLFAVSWLALLSWIQVSATFLGIVLVWVVYASNVMRFSWVPTTTDSVMPFLIGLLEFTLVETLGPATLGIWFVLMAMLVGIMNWIAHATMRRARLDADNEPFFRDRQPATLRDFYEPMAAVAGLLLAGLYLFTSGDQGILSLCALLATTSLLAGQFFVTARFWKKSLAEG
jgi:hypothetical protein